MIEPQTASLYDQDFALWAQTQAKAIADRNWSAVDIENVAEEILSLSRSDKHAVLSALERLIEHVIKLESMPESPAARGWQISIDKHAIKLRRLLRESPSLNPYLDAGF